MKLQIINDSGVLLEIDNVHKPPYGIEVVNAQGGVSLSGALRAKLSEFFYSLPVEIDQPVQPVYSGNVVPFRKRTAIPVVAADLPEIS